MDGSEAMECKELRGWWSERRIGQWWLSGREPCVFFFFFNDTATTEIYTLSLHDALPISEYSRPCGFSPKQPTQDSSPTAPLVLLYPPWLYWDRKSTRLNSSHLVISYAVFCLKKKKQTNTSIYLSVHQQIAHLFPTYIHDYAVLPYLDCHVIP